jgi:hypothetical protein
MSNTGVNRAFTNRPGAHARRVLARPGAERGVPNAH